MTMAEVVTEPQQGYRWQFFMCTDCGLAVQGQGFTDAFHTHSCGTVTSVAGASYHPLSQEAKFTDPRWMTVILGGGETTAPLRPNLTLVVAPEGR